MQKQVGHFSPLTQGYSVQKHFRSNYDLARRCEMVCANRCCDNTVESVVVTWVPLETIFVVLIPGVLSNANTLGD